MWLTTTRGFYSAVAHRDNPADLLIRARSRDDLERLCELPGMPDATEIDDIQPADYPYRITVARTNWTNRVLPALMEEVDYDNFKNAVKAKMPEGEGARRAGIYMGVWSRMLSVTPSDDPSRAHTVTGALWDDPVHPGGDDDEDPWGPLPPPVLP